MRGVEVWRVWARAMNGGWGGGWGEGRRGEEALDWPMNRWIRRGGEAFLVDFLRISPVGLVNSQRSIPKGPVSAMSTVGREDLAVLGDQRAA